MGWIDPGFHTLLTSGRPKQSASSRFCSHTVQRPAKPKPLCSHSIASKALNGPSRCVEGLEAADPRHGPLDPEVVTLDPLLQVLGHVMHRGARQQAGSPRSRV